MSVKAEKQSQREVDLEGEQPEIVKPTRTVRVSGYYRKPRSKPSVPLEG